MWRVGKGVVEIRGERGRWSDRGEQLCRHRGVLFCEGMRALWLFTKSLTLKRKELRS